MSGTLFTRGASKVYELKKGRFVLLVFHLHADQHTVVLNKCKLTPNK